MGTLVKGIWERSFSHPSAEADGKDLHTIQFEIMAQSMA